MRLERIWPNEIFDGEFCVSDRPLQPHSSSEGGEGEEDREGGEGDEVVN